MNKSPKNQDNIELRSEEFGKNAGKRGNGWSDHATSWRHGYWAGIADANQNQSPEILRLVEAAKNCCWADPNMDVHRESHIELEAALNAWEAKNE